MSDASCEVIPLLVIRQEEAELIHCKKISSFQSLPRNFQNSYLENGQILRTYFLIPPKFHLIPPKFHLIPPKYFLFPR